MSLQFSDPTNKNGIIELIDDLCDSNSGTYPLEKKTRDINLALAYVWATIFKCGGTWQYDDSNNTDYPIITTNLVAGQRDYAFVTDEQGNLILDIYKVLIAQPDGTYVEIKPVDVQSDKNVQGFYNGKNVQGTPTKYDKTANGIFLDAIPSYNSTNGLKVYINREGSFFAKTDTTKKAGFAGLFHEFLALRPAFQYASRNTKPNTNNLFKEMSDMETSIKTYYGQRQRDVKNHMTPYVTDTK